MKSVKALYRASHTDYEGLDTYTAMPTKTVPIETIEPFIFLNHHGPQAYPAHNAGLPFGPHPHKGFETVTLILKGDVVHADSSGHLSTIYAGGIQWMTAGKGIVHSENSSESFKNTGGEIELLQLWINLPASMKHATPNYTGLQKENIPVVTSDEGKVIMHLVSGSWNSVQAPIQSLSAVHLSWIEYKKGGKLQFDIPAEEAVLLYVINGKLNVNGETTDTHELVQFNANGTEIQITAVEDSIILFGHAVPNKEPIVAHGPFVMNTREEIRQAFLDYQQGKFNES